MVNKVKIRNTTIEIMQGDITDRNVDAIVNAANNELQHGGGVALAIVKKGGYVIQEESNKFGFCETGKAVITTGGNLKANFVIHTPGPIYGEGDEDKKLKKAILCCLNLANSKNLKSMAFPAISTGIYRFPKDKCAKIMLNTIAKYVKTKDTDLREIFVVLYDGETYNIFDKEFKNLKI
ncbi:MAG: macro domain-containing protein [Candidatus Altiarchaeum hamiconexum]|uniref:Macro domain-containing protein n=2 Tax=Candidatus Altarchaeum hamiconexum TaxID=1803513 RepID=A0A8J8CH88_9ARCH|nr:macro domain-containing protein [Candidatus Altarchaeum hamiconexum]NCS91671.1 macro domain-containing protein [Candidatus Altarchaeum hamiconexum]OIQ05288.1 MAG: macrodomain protein [Candidatus Altarchaeum sp. CG2_30_32_3053]PIN67887.1 MAG: macrodomain protein [Candidatus Altarchaeum sp. CG12_big_fil_rev_8_21_14_0_65_33_22]PIZ29463.1 MAG: macrodomain protein [Candidatus Altarchaeum sp. CG_4_10_14_0_8_um_filter_32_851]